MGKYTQANRLLEVRTPLGPDVLLLTGFTGREAISRFFTFKLELRAERGTKIAFDKLMGQSVSVRVTYAEGKERYFNGIISRFSQAGRDEVFTHYRAQVVPQFWLWTKKVQSRIFQHLAVPDILKLVLAGLKVTWEIHDKYEPRDYCVQYRESDSAFAGRLMEEEGIYYFFKHAEGSHEMVVTDVADKHPDVSDVSTVKYEEAAGGWRPELCITAWEKRQELHSGKYTLWDRCFELPDKHLEAERSILDSVAVGAVRHQLQVGGNDKLEIYDYPGGYAQRFDGIDKGGALQPAELQKIFQDNKRTVKLRMEQEQLPSLEIEGIGDCGQFCPGHSFTLEGHFDADGPYLLTGVRHTAKLGGNFRSGGEASLEYSNEFTAIPAALPYRPQRVTPKPSIAGMQTAVVVGPPGEEIFCDQYGRVKVQFYWDRQGKLNADSSCWVRVGQPAAGKGFGTVSLPRIGQEVIVGFEEGDPDMPLIVGSVYNAENMPPYKLPDERTFSGVKHQSHRGVARNASEIRFQNQLGSELLVLHAETDSLQQTENNQHTQVGNVHRHEVGQFYHVVVGKPVNVNQAVVGIQGEARGSGVGGGLPVAMKEPDQLLADGLLPGATGSGAGGGDESKVQVHFLPDGREEDTFPKPGLLTEVLGNNGTIITGNNWTDIGGNDSYYAGGNVDTTIAGNNSTTITGNDTYYTGADVDTTIRGNNSTKIHGDDHYSLDGTGYSEIQGDSHTDIGGDDNYKAANSYSSVRGHDRSFSGEKSEATLLHTEVKVVHLEADGINIQLSGIKLNKDGIKKYDCGLQILTFG
jgi:type VI secretion system secreted protein VgrG